MTLKQVDYEGMDPKKRYALRAGKRTAGAIRRLGMEEIDWTRGESYHAIRVPGGIVVSVPEGLGTKDDAADKMRFKFLAAQEVFEQFADYGEIARNLQTKASLLFRDIGQDNVAVNANDIITSGVSPAEFMMHVDVGTRWLSDEQRWFDLVDGTEQACLLAGCCWGGGETAELNTLPPDACVLSGMMWGFTTGEIINPASIQDGDDLFALISSGTHSNGYTGLRDLAPKLPKGYLTIVPGSNGKTFGEMILAPTNIYVDAIERCLGLGVRIHAIFNITGHAFCKLMRPEQPHAYVIEDLPHRELFDAIQEWTGIDNKKMLRTFNCGAGMVFACPPEDLKTVFEAIDAMPTTNPEHPIVVWKCGHVEASATRQVHIPQWNVEYGPEDLQIR